MEPGGMDLLCGGVNGAEVRRVADMAKIRFEPLNEQNLDRARGIHREDVSQAWVDSADTIMQLTRYGVEHHCLGRTFLVWLDQTCIGLILLGEAIPWETDPPEMKGVSFYRLMGFVLDRRYRGQGIGGYVLETVVQNVYQEFGARPIALGVHRDNRRAARFYEKHGFTPREQMEGNDRYYLRYPEGWRNECGDLPQGTNG